MSNTVKKPTAREFGSWRKMLRESPSFNDAWNIQHFGIDSARFNELNKLAISALGPSFSATCDFPEMLCEWKRQGNR